MVSKERQDLVLKLARFESAGMLMSGGEAFDGFGDAGNSGTVTDPVEDPSLMWDRAVSRMRCMHDHDQSLFALSLHRPPYPQDFLGCGDPMQPPLYDRVPRSLAGDGPDRGRHQVEICGSSGGVVTAAGGDGSATNSDRVGLFCQLTPQHHCSSSCIASTVAPLLAGHTRIFSWTSSNRWRPDEKKELIYLLLARGQK